MCAFRYFLPIISVFVISACQTIPSGSEIVTKSREQLATTTVSCENLSSSNIKPLPIGEEKEKAYLLDSNSQVFNFDSGNAYFDIFSLPDFTSPYSITISTVPEGGGYDLALLEAGIQMLDDDFKLTRDLSRLAPRLRGNMMEKTVFVNPSNVSERYLLVYGKNTNNVKSEKVSSMSAVPISIPVPGGIVTFVNYVGDNVVQKVSSSPSGKYYLYIK